MKKIFVLIAFLLIFPKNTLALGNPASVFCVKNGGTLKIVNGPTGMYALCQFKDGTECEEWAFAREECNPGQHSDWSAVQPKDPDFEFVQRLGAWVVDKNNTGKYVEKNVAKYFYHRIAVKNANMFSSVSEPVKMVVYGDTTETFIIPSLGPKEESETFDIFIPIDKNYEKDIEINPDRSIIETNYENNIQYSNSFYERKREEQKQKDLLEKKSTLNNVKILRLSIIKVFAVIVLLGIIYFFQKRKHE